jgi:hypothetical protein
MNAVDEVSSGVERLVDSAIPEGPSLEYKETLTLRSPRDRRESAKDLSGMGNGGGGRLVYGVRERKNQPGLPESIVPLHKLGDVGRLEDIVRSSIRPPLLATYRTGVLEAGGFVLVVDVERSPLGPYMVEALGERRYFVRIGSRTAPMTEQQIRDAYALAARAREGRADTWAAHSLPIRGETEGPWLTVSGLPEEPLTDLWDPATTSKGIFWLPDQYRIQRGLSATEQALRQPRIWAEGLFGEDGYGDRAPFNVVRIHRDGAIGLGQRLSDPLARHGIARAVNAELFYLAWAWRLMRLRTSAELHIALIGIEGTTMPISDWRADPRTLSQPPGVSVDRVALHVEALHGELARAGPRHAIVRQFANRLHQAFGLGGANPMFLTGWLFGRDGLPLKLSLYGDGIWPRQGMKVGYVYRNGPIESAMDNRRIAGYVVDGAVLDEEGDTMAVLEFAAGPAVPDEFLHANFYDDPRAAVPDGRTGEPGDSAKEFAVPTPTGRWSAHSLATRLLTLDW